MTRARASAAPDIPGLVYVQPLGSGGYADVYLFEQQTPRMPVAVKVLKAAGLTEALKAQFAEEADTMAALGDHPYIVPVFRSGVSTDGRPYLVMKYYPPPNLAARARTERFSVADVLRMGIQLASAIETAHRAHVTHRDIKPANVLISAYGAPGLTDFGIAGRGGLTGMAAESAGDPGDSAGEVGVSVPWAAPEVLYGQSNGDVRSDIYSLAATLWQLLVGRSPFEIPGGDNTAYALMPRIHSTPVPPTGRPDVPAGLERVLAHAMAKDPLARPASALEFARMLQAVEQEQRLQRTEIVVLDDSGNTQLVGHGGAGGDGATGGAARSGRPADTDLDEDRTRVKAPQRVAAQGLPGASERTGPGARYVDPHDLAYRPVPQPASPAAPTPVLPTEDDDRTVLRARPVDPSRPAGQPPADTSAGTRWGRSRMRLVAIAAGLVIALAAGGYAIRRVQDTPTAPPTPPTIVSSPRDTAAVDGVFERPVVSAESGIGEVKFTWSYPGRLGTDRYRLKMGPSSDEAARATPLPVTEPAYVAKVPAGTTVCASVSVIRSGLASPPASPKCETAR